MTHFQVRDKIILTSFLHTLTVRGFVLPIKEPGLSGPHTQHAAPRHKLAAPLCPGHPSLKKKKKRPFSHPFQYASPRLGSHVPTDRGETRGWKAFLPSSERCFVRAGRGTALESVSIHCTGTSKKKLDNRVLGRRGGGLPPLLRSIGHGRIRSDRAQHSYGIF